MAKRPFVVLASFALLVIACGGGGATTAPSISTPTSAATVAPASHAATPAATTAASMAPESMAPESMTPESMAPESPGGSPAESPAESAGASSSPAAAVCNATAGQAVAGASFDPSGVSGSATLGHWDSSPAENSALDCALKGFAMTYPDVAVTNTDVSGDYAAQMVTKFGTPGSAPDLFYVNGDTVIDWATQGFLTPLDDYIANQGIDMSAFYPGYQDTFKVDGKTYGIAKDGNTIAMAYNKDLVPNPPTTLDELVQVATSLKGTGNLVTPMCLNPGLDRGLAFLYAQGGSLISDDNKTEEITTDASKAAVQWYMDLFKDGLGAPAPSGSWCGEQLGKGNVAIVFEGGWLKGFMDSTYPDVNWSFAEMPRAASASR